MRTLAIKIGKLSDDQSGYPITLHRIDPDNEQLEASVIEKQRADAVIATVADLFTNSNRDGQALHRIGRTLFELLNQTEPGIQWKLLCQEADDQGPSVLQRTYLDIEPTELSWLPWELMLDSGQPVFASQGHHVSRGCPVPAARQDEPTSLPIRVLVVVCEDLPSAESEVYDVYWGLASPPGIWQVEVLREPDKKHFIERMEQFAPQVLHIVGGAARPTTAHFIVRPSGERWSLALDDIPSRKADSPPPPLLLVLGACRTDQMVLSERLRRRGIRAVVALRPEISSEQPGELIRTLYEQLAETGSLEAAMWATRHRLWQIDAAETTKGKHLKTQEQESPKGAGWAKAVLTVYGSPDDLAWSNLPQLAQHVRAMSRRTYYQQIGQLVDRIHEHITVWGKKPGHPDQKLVLLSGRPRAGKSELIRSCMHTWELRGVRTVLVDMKVPGERENLNTQALLHHICQTLRNRLDELRLPTADDVTEINHQLNAIEAALGDANPAVPAVSSHNSVLHQAEFEALCGVLATIAGDHPLLLLFDHVEEIMRDAQRRFVVNLLAPIERGSTEGSHGLNNVYAIAAGHTQSGSRPEDGWPPTGSYLDWSADRVEVPLFPFEKREFLFREFGARKRWPEQNWCTLALAQAMEARRSDWSPEVLPTIAQIYEWSME